MARVAPIALALSLALSAGIVHADDPVDNGPIDITQPRYTTDDRWVRPMLIGIGSLFAAALVVGGLVWAKRRDLVPTAASHEEDPSADRH